MKNGEMEFFSWVQKFHLILEICVVVYGLSLDILALLHKKNIILNKN